MAKVFIKGLREPLFLNDAQAIALKDDWENRRLTAIVRIGGLSTVQSADIKGIFLDSEARKQLGEPTCGVEKCEGGCHWIIERADGHAIWKQAYQTKEEALAEMKMENLFTYGALVHKFK